MARTLHPSPALAEGPPLPRARERRRVNTQEHKIAEPLELRALRYCPRRRRRLGGRTVWQVATRLPGPNGSSVRKKVRTEKTPQRLKEKGAAAGTAGRGSRPRHLRLRAVAAPRLGASPLRLPPPPLLLLGAVSLSPLARPFPPQPRLPRVSRCGANCWSLLRCCTLSLPVSCCGLPPPARARGGLAGGAGGPLNVYFYTGKN